MHLRKLGETGLSVSEIGLGCNNFGARLDFAATERVVHAALDAGVSLFDTADAYGRGVSEEFLGAALGKRRANVVLVTKFGLPMDDAAKSSNGSFDYAMKAVEASLKRLRTDWIDLYFFHRPDPETPIAETLRALDFLIRQGKVRHAGCSNFSAAQLEEAQHVAKASGLHPLMVYQDQYNLVSREIEKDLIPAADAHRMALLPYFPLASGLLTGKYRLGAPLPPGTRMSSSRYADRFLNDKNLRVVEALLAFCAARNRSLLELAFGWLLARPRVASVIAGASSPGQLLQNTAAASWQLTPGDLEEIDRITQMASETTQSV